jgi:hypothetical protein
MILGNTASLVEYNNKKIGDYSVELKKEGYPTDQFGIEVSGIEQGVCERLQDYSISNAVKVELGGVGFAEATCAEGEANILTYTFNDALDPNKVSAGGGNDDPECKGVTCADGLTCFNGECKCSDGTLMCGTECCAEGTYCAQGKTGTLSHICATPTGACAKNSDCDTETQYCKFDWGDCTGPTGGTCTAKGTLSSITLELGKGDLTVYKSSGTMTWWSAKNLCQAHGLQMVTMADLGISESESQNYCYFDNTASGYATYPCNCAGDPDCSKTGSRNPATGLYALGTSGYIWLADNSKVDSCYARSLNLYSGVGNIANHRRGDSSYDFALCR